ncbi:MAG: ATP-dependent helicase [Planctomycetota bacterium]|nr:ATP-dependent helicase [Planctomycetota bacterium]
MKDYPLKGASVPQFKIEYEKELNPQQLEVVTHRGGPMLVIAGAGSGKTRTVTYRVARLIEAGCDPAAILLMTFTNKAARDMLRRVEMLIGPQVQRVWGGTFHHVGALVLRQHARLLGYQPNFTILDRDDSETFLEGCVPRVGVDRKTTRFPKAEVLSDVIGLAVNTDRKIADIVVERYPYHMQYIEQIEQLARRYDTEKQSANVMDFDDLLTRFRLLLETHDEVRNLYARRFAHVLVDEYQDTNRIQSDVVHMLASHHRNLMVVGDDAQSIYSFRGANFANIIGFSERYPDVRLFKLTTNYRSTPEVLSLANSSIARNKRQYPKELVAVKRSGQTPVLAYTPDAAAQARFITQRILEIHEQNVPLSQIAVLYRAHYHSMELQMELTRSGVAFEVRSGIRFFQQAHVKDVAAYLKMVANPRDELAWRRAFRLCPRIGPATSDKLWKAIGSAADPLKTVFTEQVEKQLPRAAFGGWERFLECLKRIKTPEMAANPAAMIDTVIESGYDEYIKDTFANAEIRLEELRQLANFARGFENLDTFLTQLSLHTNAAGEDSAPEDAQERDRLVLSTVHQAKGLEWKCVFVLWLTDGRFPDKRSVRETGGEEEERRLFYVACTRAKEELYLSCPMMARDGQFDVLQQPSRFVTEIDEDRYEKWNVVPPAPSWAEMDDGETDDADSDGDTGPSRRGQTWGRTDDEDDEFGDSGPGRRRSRGGRPTRRGFDDDDITKYAVDPPGEE